MLIRHALPGFINRVILSKHSLFVPLFDAMLPKHMNVLAIVEGEEGRLLVPAHNIVTDAGDVYYAQKSASETPTNTFNTLTLATAGTPGKSATYASFTPIASTGKTPTAAYPKTNDADADNTGASTKVVTWLFSYAKADFNNAAISHGEISATAPSGSVPLMTGFAFAAPFAKTANDTLKVFVNHQMLGV